MTISPILLLDDTVPGKQLGLRKRKREREEKTKEEYTEKYPTRGKTDRAERAVVINLHRSPVRPLRVVGVYNHGALKS